MSEKEYMHELLKKDAVCYDLPNEEIIKLLANENESLKQQRDDLLVTLKNARVSMKVMLLPQLDEHVANNSDILRIMDNSFEVAIAKCEA